ncbi:hypothetical protein M413DRAFT_188069 [Hebeloma cylindrosporum]|uniref:DNA2/NAM7 helicase helicase domain-containing protein n=1 Tax=Hebeloma cylindrosporum TaxID=76867 RepID=A0A0C2XQP5_HEBCY|nr:hypothetical protein M413DRAFT_188069 [Hebeloma cylindrosporum h7]
MMRTAANQFVRIDAVRPDGTATVTRGRTQHVQGKTSRLSIPGGLGNTKIRSLQTIGKERPTCAESLRTHCMLGALQKTMKLSENPFINVMWFPIENHKSEALWTGTPRLSRTPSVSFPGDRKLNASQLKAVKTSLSREDSDRVILIHGPPGTGKTTVIAATVTSVMSSSDDKRTLWLVAQSNVAVKNIAEKLASVDFVDFKVLVSKDFHLDWHEHLYHKIEHNVLRSDDFSEDLVGADRQLLKSRVILCTLGMLSNDKIRIFTHIVPIQTVIFDEASQIEIGDYLPMLIRFRPTLHKLIFIGDNKQLAPYGSSDIPTLHSIFEKCHMLKQAVFLDTQCQ